jgi:hypothetical protein
VIKIGVHVLKLEEYIDILKEKQHKLTERIEYLENEVRVLKNSVYGVKHHDCEL